VILHEDDHDMPLEDHVAKHFTGAKARWKPTYDTLLAEIKAFGPGVTESPGSTYISLLRGGKKFAIVQVTANRPDLGIKLKGAPVEGRFEAAGAWNAMVTHRVRIDDPAQVDAEVIGWLRRAYDKAA
jgi:predicted transport protein